MKYFSSILIILSLNACNGDGQKYEYIEKNDAFRQTLKTGHFIELSEGFTYYESEDLNNENVIVFIHGFSVPGYIWDETYYEAIKRGFGVLRLDTYGRGYSDNPDVDYTDELFATQVVELLDALNITQKVTFAGLSNGGRVISKFAENHSDRIKRLIYVSPGGFHPPWTVYDNQEVTEEEISNFIKNKYPTISQGQMADFKDPSKFKGWDKKYESLLKYNGFARALLSTRKHQTILDDLNTKIGQMDIAQYAIWGDSDPVLPLNEVADKIPLIMPKLKLFVIKDSGHLPHKEQFEAFNQIFFEKILVE
ncbi:MAG: alpha/beta hydrolase [Candidatus Marinimicrobia bacterium]|nr:alpha/beta hydrolase [Candidatus Neomarinimicrobiota bacterium]MBL7011237.1 alpha/beta hydrolase [Candidatus Neomarinimicrobiota bacterium]MBL7030711.1 alpha/beta hydrolase [Candidatus Neomarinimicrobiota bacterium]